jgi:uncharacterized protein (TIGR02246 family)
MNVTDTDTRTIAAALVGELERAWNRGDGRSFGAAFTDDADFVDIRGSHHHGRDAIAHGHQAIFDSIYRGSSVLYEITTSDAIADGAILAVVAATLDAPGGPLQGVHHSTVSVVVVRDPAGDGWKIRSFHNTLIAA